MEFFEDLWESEPKRAMALFDGVEDDVVLQTGDPELDEIERRLAAGEDPDEVLAGWGDGLGEGEPAEDFTDDYRFADETPSGGLSWSRRE